MKLLLLCLLLSVGLCDKWAVLVAGSSTWSNYRHQADVYHAYHTLVKGGFDPAHIITFAYDDIADNINNPYKGKVFNKPTYNDPGVDVYAGIKIDYSKLEVTPKNFLAVLEGNAAAVKGKGSGRVLGSTSNDNVFIFFSDHGAPGYVAFPHANLYATQLLTTFQQMKTANKYKKIVFYLEACESGSMFTKLPTDTRVYGLSAASASESSWGCYCSPDDVVGGKHIKSCLGDLFAVSFVEDTDSGDYSQTLNHQFETIKRLTNKSHVMQWGDLSFNSDPIGDFLTGPNTPSKSLRFVRPYNRVGTHKPKGSLMDSRTMKLQTLAAAYSLEHSAQTMIEMMAEIESMRHYETIFRRFAAFHEVSGNYDAYNINFDCLKSVVSNFEAKCGRFSDYGLGFVKYIAEACEKVSANAILSALDC